MKKIWILAIGLFTLGDVQAQDKKKSTVKEDVKETTKDVAHETKEAAKKVGNKTAELGAKGAARVTDQVYKEKQGPDGQTIYIDNDSKYYWIDKKGKKIYVSKAQLKDK